MSPIVIILILVIIISAFIIMYIITHNKLHYYKVRIDVAENIIDEALRKKYDLLCDLNIDIKKVIKDKDYLKEFVDYKNHRLTNYETDRKLVEGFNLINELKGDHKKLGTKKFENKLKQLQPINEELESGKNYFNKNTTKMNMLIRKFTTNVVAKRHKFKIKPYFDNKNTEDAVLDDFKL